MAQPFCVGSPPPLGELCLPPFALALDSDRVASIFRWHRIFSSCSFLPLSWCCQKPYPVRYLLSSISICAPGGRVLVCVCWCAWVCVLASSERVCQSISKYAEHVAFGIYDYCRKANICLQRIKTTVKRTGYVYGICMRWSLAVCACMCLSVCVGHVLVFFLAISPSLSFALRIIIKTTPTTTTSGNNGQRKTTTTECDVVGWVFFPFFLLFIHSWSEFLCFWIFMLTSSWFCSYKSRLASRIGHNCRAPDGLARSCEYYKIGWPSTLGFGVWHTKSIKNLSQRCIGILFKLCIF